MNGWIELIKERERMNYSLRKESKGWAAVERSSSLWAALPWASGPSHNQPKRIQLLHPSTTQRESQSNQLLAFPATATIDGFACLALCWWLSWVCLHSIHNWFSFCSLLFAEHYGRGRPITHHKKRKENQSFIPFSSAGTAAAAATHKPKKIKSFLCFVWWADCAGLFPWAPRPQQSTFLLSSHSKEKREKKCLICWWPAQINFINSINNCFIHPFIQQLS